MVSSRGFSSQSKTSKHTLRSCDVQNGKGKRIGTKPEGQGDQQARPITGGSSKWAVFFLRGRLYLDQGYRAEVLRLELEYLGVDVDVDVADPG